MSLNPQEGAYDFLFVKSKAAHFNPSTCKHRQSLPKYIFIYIFLKNTCLCVPCALPHPLKHNDAVGPGPAKRLGNVLSKPIYLLHAAPTATQVSARWEGRWGGAIGAAHPCLLDVIYTKSSPFFFSYQCCLQSSCGPSFIKPELRLLFTPHITCLEIIHNAPMLRMRWIHVVVIGWVKASSCYTLFAKMRQKGLGNSSRYAFFWVNPPKSTTWRIANIQTLTICWIRFIVLNVSIVIIGLRIIKDKKFTGKCTNYNSCFWW